LLEPFRNEPLTDFSRPENRQAFEAALDRAEARFGSEYPVVIGGERIYTRDKIRSLNPSSYDQVVGLVSRAGRDLAERAVQTAWKAWNEEWKHWHPEERARILFKAAAIMRRRKHDLSAAMVLEVGKNWAEADADTAEAVDFLEYYGREMLRLHYGDHVTRTPGEDNELFYIPLGVGLVIPPWNFPCAILTGMTSASLVTGNTVILKPASTSPVIGFLVFEILEEAGLPPGVLNFVPGSGAEIGDYLVEHPLTRFVHFTGSKEVGLRIAELAARIRPGQRWIKRVMAEMGGKDAIIVDETADLEAAAEGITVSAFGYQGQKCSACSRAILVEPVYDRVLNLVAERARRITVGPVRDPANWMGPVADEGQYRKILEYLDVGRGEGWLVTGGGKAEGPGLEGGYFIEPTIFAWRRSAGSAARKSSAPCFR